MVERDGLQHSHEEAFRSFLAHRTMLMAYIRAIVHEPNLAEETLHDVSMEIVRSWDRYDSSRPFANWARGVARRVALANLRKSRKEPALLGAEVLEAVGTEIDALGDEAHLEARKQALRECLERLARASRRLVRLRYFENRSYQEMAETVARSVEALYVAFSRIHRALHDCIQERLAAE